MVPVLDKEKQPLMPCSEKRARKLMEKGRAKPYWCKGVFCIILQYEPSGREMQDIVVAIDPGSKFSGYSVKSEKHTFINVQLEAPTKVKAKVEERAMNRRARRRRNTPYRKCRFNRSVKNRIPPSTKARWQQHLNMVKWFSKMYAVTVVAVEDIKARTLKNGRKWNAMFSPLQVGKQWFYNEIKALGLNLYKYAGFDTARLRQEYGVGKNSQKDKKCFFTHCVDAWVIAAETIGGSTVLDNIRTMYLKPLMYHRRKLHEIVPKKNGFRRSYGGTISLGLRRGTLVKHLKYGLCLIAGSSKGRVSLHDFRTNARLCQNAKPEDLKILTNLKWNIA